MYILGRNKFLSIVYVLLSTSPLLLQAQNKTTYNTRIKKARDVYINGHIKDKDKTLALDKYLDTTKPIIIMIGSNRVLRNIESLRFGFNPFNLGGDNVVSFKIERGKIVINCVIYSINGEYSAKIKNNKLVPSQEYEQYANDTSIEVIDKKNNPVFQAIVNKKDNSIKIYCVTYTENICLISTRGGSIFRSFEKPFALMSDQELKLAKYQVEKFIKENFKAIN